MGGGQLSKILTISGIGEGFGNCGAWLNLVKVDLERKC